MQTIQTSYNGQVVMKKDGNSYMIFLNGENIYGTRDKEEAERVFRNASQSY